MEATLNYSLKVVGSATALSPTNTRVDKNYRSVLSTVAKSSVQDIILSVSVADHVIDFGEITSANYVVIVATGNVSLKLNGAANSVQVGKFFAIYDGAAITSAKISDLSGALNPVTVILGA